MAYTLPTELAVVQAPMAGGPSTAQLASAVANAGGLGFVAGAYLSPAQLLDQIELVRHATTRPFGVNLFVPSHAGPRAAIEAYRAEVEPEALRLGALLGDSSWDDDRYPEKIDILTEDPPHLVTFTFGAPTGSDVDRLQRVGAYIGVSVTSVAEARIAAGLGADVLIVQGTEAGGHQATFTGETVNETPLLDALRAIGAVGLPMIATGGIMTAPDATAAVAAGAIGVQIGTALLCTPEAATTPVHRAALLGATFEDTVVTRAYSGRYARGLRNRFAREHPDAPNAYPEIHYLTRPMRQAAIAAGDADVPNLWAGTNWRAITAAPAADIVRRIAAGVSADRAR